MQEAKLRFRRPSAEEQTVLREMTLKRLVSRKDIEQCDQILTEHHYLHSAKLVGEQLRYAVSWKGQWLAVAAWSAPALHLKARDRFIGWTEEQQHRLQLPWSRRQYGIPKARKQFRACMKVRNTSFGGVSSSMFPRT